MSEEKPHVCIVGPSGIGKSPLASLFKLPSFEPYRVRIPRDEKDRLVCKTTEQAQAVFSAELSPATWSAFKEGQDDARLHCGKNWLFFKVRRKMQCLEFRQQGTLLLDRQSRIEIFAPTLCSLLRTPTGTTVGLNAKDIIFIVLNPTGRSYREQVEGLDSKGVDSSLTLAVFYGITKRSELQQKPVNVPDALNRVEQIRDEVGAWAELLTFPFAVEFCEWKHSEFRYHQPNGSRSDAVRELLAARETVLRILNGTGNGMIQNLTKPEVFRTADEVQELTDIV